MKKILVGIIIGFMISGVSYAYRVSKPNRITDFDQRGLVIVNDNFEKLWDITNGRYSLDIVTTNPDGATKGDVGDILLLSTGGNFYLEINTNGGTQWNGVQLTNTP